MGRDRPGQVCGQLPRRGSGQILSAAPVSTLTVTKCGHGRGGQNAGARCSLWALRSPGQSWHQPGAEAANELIWVSHRSLKQPSGNPRLVKLLCPLLEVKT